MSISLKLKAWLLVLVDRSLNRCFLNRTLARNSRAKSTKTAIVIIRIIFDIELGLNGSTFFLLCYGSVVDVDEGVYVLSEIGTEEHIETFFTVQLAVLVGIKGPSEVADCTKRLDVQLCKKDVG